MKEIFKYIMVFLVIIISLLFIAPSLVKANKNELKEQYSLKIIHKDTSWIYEITKNTQLIIRQEFIPAVKGKQVFKSEKDAKTIGKIVLKKLTDNEIPMITMKDLKSNKIIFKDI